MAILRKQIQEATQAVETLATSQVGSPSQKKEALSELQDLIENYMEELAKQAGE